MVSSVFKIIRASVPCQTSVFPSLILRTHRSMPRLVWDCNRKADGSRITVGPRRDAGDGSRRRQSDLFDEIAEAAIAPDRIPPRIALQPDQPVRSFRVRGIERRQ